MNISNLEVLVEEENRWMRVRGAHPLSLLNSQDRQEIATIIDCRLSPENLTCDGELGHSEVNRRYKFLTRCRQELLSIDPAVTFWE